MKGFELKCDNCHLEVGYIVDRFIDEDILQMTNVLCPKCHEEESKK